MSRSVPEWRGKTPDTQPPPRVRVRLFTMYDGRCAQCRRKLAPGDRWEADHIKAFINGGENRESNLQALCLWCHASKTSIDVAIKSRVYQHRASHVGAKRKRSSFRTNKNGPYKKKMNGTIERRKGA